MKNEIERGDLVRFNPTQYIFEKRLKSRSWFSGFYVYKVVTLGRKWATLRMNSNNSRKLMPMHLPMFSERTGSMHGQNPD